MKKLMIVLAMAAALMAGNAIASETAATVTPDQALAKLLEGNSHYVKGDLDNLDKMSEAKNRLLLASGQAPYAIVLTCSDSRVPPEILFDKGLGEIFVVRVAGNIVAPHELGSIEYAIEHLGSSLVMVLGHERCGAVKATYDAYPAEVEGNIGSLVKDIAPAVEAVIGHTPKPTGTVEKAAQVEECIVENIKMVAESLEVKSPIVKEFVHLGKVKIVRAKYDLDDGKVRVLDSETATH